jgi:hypothetical protein
MLLNHLSYVRLVHKYFLLFPRQFLFCTYLLGGWDGAIRIELNTNLLLYLLHNLYLFEINNLSGVGRMSEVEDAASSIALKINS